MTEFNIELANLRIFLLDLILELAFLFLESCSLHLIHNFPFVVDAFLGLDLSICKRGFWLMVPFENLDGCLSLN